MHTVLAVNEHWVRIANIVVDKVALHQEVLAQLPPSHLLISRFIQVITSCQFDLVPIWQDRADCSRYLMRFHRKSRGVWIIGIPHLAFCM